MLRHLFHFLFSMVLCNWANGFVNLGKDYFPQQTIRYDNYSLLRFTWPQSSNQLPNLRSLATSWDAKGDLDIWGRSVNDGFFELDVLMSPRSKSQAIYSIKQSHNINVSIVSENIQDRFDAEYMRSLDVRNRSSSGYFDDFRTLDEVNARLYEYAEAYPDLVEPMVLGRSFEDRAIQGIVITGRGSDKPEIWVNGGIHAREWLSPPTVMWLIENLLLKYNNPLYPEITELVDGFVWNIVPVLNPDGYEYTWRHDRNWRKTRKPNVGSSCIGTDPNRNYDSHWGTVGVSHDPCSNNYCGAEAFDNPEIAAVRDFFRIHTKLVAVLDVHTCGQLLLSPWGWTSDFPEDWERMEPFLQKFCSAVQETYDTTWACGPASTTIYPCSGITSDYAYDAHGIYNAYSPELRCDATSSTIPLSGTEMFNGITTWTKMILNQVRSQGIQSLRK